MATTNSSSELQVQRSDVDDEDNDAGSSADGRGRWRTEKVTADIRQWLTAVYTRSVKAGERLLKEGRMADAATAFANATLLTDQPGAFASAMDRVYPPYFYWLYEQRMTAMGYGHLFAAADNKAAIIVARKPRHGSPQPSKNRSRLLRARPTMTRH